MPGRGHRTPRSPPARPVFSQHLAAELVTDRQPDARPGRRQNGVGAALGAMGGKECGSGKRGLCLDAGSTAATRKP